MNYEGIISFFLSDRFIFGSWAEHTASWWPYRDRDNVLLLIYGEMKQNPQAIIKQIADWMGKMWVFCTVSESFGNNPQISQIKRGLEQISS